MYTDRYTGRTFSVENLLWVQLQKSDRPGSLKLYAELSLNSDQSGSLNLYIQFGAAWLVKIISDVILTQ